MNREIMKAAGFESALIAIDAGLCPLCDRSIEDTPFKDALSLKEFKISGLCQICQDSIFEGE
jgi:hypothetical protein